MAWGLMKRAERLWKKASLSLEWSRGSVRRSETVSSERPLLPRSSRSRSRDGEEREEVGDEESEPEVSRLKLSRSES